MTGSTERVSPLAGWSERFASAGTASFAIREQAGATQVNLRCAPEAARAANAVLGFALPDKANTWAGDARTAALWLGPDEWLVLAEPRREAELCSALRAAFGDRHHSVVDVSAMRAIIELSGADARLVLAKGCPLDLHAGNFGPGHCAQSLLAKAQVILQCIDSKPVMRVLVRNSFGNYAAEWLLDAAAELVAARNAGMLGLRL